MTATMQTTDEPGPAPGGGLASRLQVETADAHRTAEHAPFIQDLLAGRLPVEEYARLVAQHVAIYEALESRVVEVAEPLLAPFLAPELLRLPSLRADLAFLLDGIDPASVEVLEATRHYVDHLHELADTWPAGLLAHHYVRYLGDLSGGQVIGRVLQRVYGFEDGRGTAFYRFEEIPSPKAHKVRYRGLLDAVDAPTEVLDRLVAEASVAYACNADVFFELGPLPRLASGAHPKVDGGYEANGSARRA